MNCGYGTIQLIDIQLRTIKARLFWEREKSVYAGRQNLSAASAIVYRVDLDANEQLGTSRMMKF